MSDFFHFLLLRSPETILFIQFDYFMIFGNLLFYWLRFLSPQRITLPCFSWNFLVFGYPYQKNKLRSKFFGLLSLNHSWSLSWYFQKKLSFNLKAFNMTSKLFLFSFCSHQERNSSKVKFIRSRSYNILVIKWIHHFEKWTIEFSSC